MRRLRPDLRPTFTVADGRRLEMSSEAYSGHHGEREAMAGVNGSHLGPSIQCDQQSVNSLKTQFIASR